MTGVVNPHLIIMEQLKGLTIIIEGDIRTTFTVKTLNSMPSIVQFQFDIIIKRIRRLVMKNMKEIEFQISKYCGSVGEVAKSLGSL